MSGNDFVTNDSFCPIPFFSLEINPTGRYSACCEADESKTATTADISANDWFYGAEMSELRNSFLAGQCPTACKRCFKKEFSGIKSRREMFTEYFNSGFYSVAGEDLIAQPGIRFTSYRFGNDCNLSCLMCDADSSTAYGRESEKLGEGVAVKHSNALRLSDQELQKLKVIYFGGGEPSMSKSSLEVLERLEHLGNTDLLVVLNSNGSLPRSAFFEKLSHFKHVHLDFSIDGSGEIYELLRYPQRWARLEQNLEQFIATYPHFQFGIIFTLNVLNAPNTPEFLRWWIDFNKRHDMRLAKFSINDLTYPQFLHLDLMESSAQQTTLRELNLLLQESATLEFERFNDLILQMMERIALAERPEKASALDQTRRSFIARREDLRAQTLRTL